MFLKNLGTYRKCRNKHLNQTAKNLKNKDFTENLEKYRKYRKVHI